MTDRALPVEGGNAACGHEGAGANGKGGWLKAPHAVAVGREEVLRRRSDLAAEERIDDLARMGEIQAEDEADRELHSALSPVAPGGARGIYVEEGRGRREHAGSDILREIDGTVPDGGVAGVPEPER